MESNGLGKTTVLLVNSSVKVIEGKVEDDSIFTKSNLNVLYSDGYVIGYVTLSEIKYLLFKYQGVINFSIFIENGEPEDIKALYESSETVRYFMENSISALGKGKEVLKAVMNSMGKIITSKELDACVNSLEEFDIEPNYRVLENKYQGMVNCSYKDGKVSRRERRAAERRAKKLNRNGRF